MESNAVSGMNVTPLNQIKPLQSVSQTVSPAEISKQFGDFLSEAVQKLNDQQNAVDQLNRKFAAGELSDVHQLMIATEKAALGLDLAVQIRNKAIEAYQEIMRMQI